MRNKLFEELRINSGYTNLFSSEYKNGLSKESTPVIKTKTMFTDTFLKHLTHSRSSVLPPNCRYLEELHSGHIVVIEEPPAFRTIKINMSFHDELDRLRKKEKLELYGYEDWQKENRAPYRFTLAFPYVLFILYISRYNETLCGQVYGRTQQMLGLSDYLLELPLLNISDRGEICFGEKIGKRCNSFVAAIQNAIMIFWSATFNQDFTYNYEDYEKVSILNSYLEWQYMSKQNPMFIYSADWIRISSTIGQLIRDMKSRYNLQSKNEMTYTSLSQAFNIIQESSMTAKPFKKSKEEHALFFDIAQGVYLNPEISINVGDSFTTKSGKVAFIDSFMGFPDGSEVKFIQLDINGKKSLLKLTDSSKKFLSQKFLEMRRAEQVTLKNGTIIKPGNIISVKSLSGNFFYKVEYIRKSRGAEGDVYEVKMGNDYFLSDTIDAELISVGDITFDGIKLNKDDLYVLKDSSSDKRMVIRGYYVKYHDINVNLLGDLFVDFKFINSNSSNIKRVELNKKQKDRILYKVDEIKPLDGICKVGRKLITITDLNREVIPNSLWGVDGLIIKDGNYSFSNITSSIIKEVISEDRFFIKGPDFDIDFKIGDHVVYANWKDPLDMLSVKEITEFKIINNSIIFILSDKNKKSLEVKYVDGEYKMIDIGRIRKVTNTIGDLSVGMKIKSNITGISCFPKKDTNIIVAFIIDTGTEPLALCSNGCTLWVSDIIKNFTIIKMGTKKWKKLQHAPLDISKIKFQSGDIINGDKDYFSKFGYLVNGSSVLYAVPLENSSTSMENFIVSEYMKRCCKLDCIPAPRISKKDNTKVVRGTFNFHSFGVIKNRLDIPYLVKTEGELDVQDSNK